MKKIILTVLVAGVTLLSADSTPIYKSGMLLPPQPAVIYEKECAHCHGKNGKQTSFSGSSRISYGKITGLNADELAQDLKNYRGGVKSKNYQPLNKYGYGALMRTTLTDLSWEEIDSLSKYIAENFK